MPENIVCSCVWRDVLIVITADGIIFEYRKNKITDEMIWQVIGRID